MELSELIKRCVGLVGLAETSFADDERGWAIDHLTDLRTLLNSQPELEESGGETDFALL